MNRITNKVVNKVTEKAQSAFNFPLVDTDVTGWLIVDGEEYEVCEFDIDFAQSVDHKGQPQTDMQGGRMLISITETVSDNIYHWSMFSKAKDGEVIFKSKTANAPLKIRFINGYCTDFYREIDDHEGLTTALVISPEKMVINDRDFDNFW